MEDTLDQKHTKLMLGVILLATLMDGLDGSIVTVALPDIGIGFGVDTATVSWVSIVYMMVLACTLILFARIASARGIRRIMVTGLALFTVSSLVCVLSVDFWMLIAARILQGVGAAMMGAAGPMCCVEFLPPRKLAFGLAVITIGSSVGFAIGPGIGGLLVEYLSWHWIFLINLPIGLIAIPLALKALPKHVRKDAPPLDRPGAALLAVGIAAGILAVETVSYASLAMVSLAAAAVCLIGLAGFIWRELRCDHPLLNIRLFRHADFSAIFLCLMLVNMAYMGIWYLVPFFGEKQLGLSSAEVGVFLLVSAVITAVFGMPVARASDRHGRRWFCVAAGLTAGTSFALFAACGGSMGLALLTLTIILMGVGWAFVGGPMASRLVEHAERGERDMASSLINEAYYVGGSLGTAVIAALFTLTAHAEGVDISDVSAAVFMQGFVPCCWLAVALCAVIVVLSAAVRDRRAAE